MRMTLAFMLVVFSSIVAAQSVAYVRGEVVTLTSAADGTRPPESRVLAVPGDRIRVARGSILVNDAPVAGLSSELLAGLPESVWEQVVPAGHYFLAGEVRDPNGATRFWGLMPAERIAGKVVTVAAGQPGGAPGGRRYLNVRISLF